MHPTRQYWRWNSIDYVERLINKIITIHSNSIIFTITLSNQILRLKGITYMQSIEWDYYSYISIFKFRKRK